LAIPWIYFGFLAWRFGNWRVWLDVRRHWGNSAWWGIHHFFTDSSVRLPEITFYVVVSIIPMCGAIMLLRHSRWRALAAFALPLMILLYAAGLAGLGRYSSSCWPAFLPLGSLLAGRPGLLLGSICAFALLQGMVLYLWVHLYPFQ
jgi:hypothetical protein